MRLHRRTPPRALLLLIPVLLLIALGALLTLRQGRPTVTDRFPAPDTVAVPSLAPIRVTFSRAMNPAAVENALQIDPPHPGTFTWDANTLTFTPTAPWPPGATITLTLTTGARASTGLPLPENITWTFTVARTMLAYLWPANGPADLYMLDAIGGDVVQLTTSGGLSDFAVRADGLVVYYSAANPSGGLDLWQLDMLTRQSERLLACENDLCAWPQPSPDGAWLAYENTMQGSVWLFPLAGGDPTRLGDGTRPQWSPEGDLAYYDRVAQAYRVLNPAGAVLNSFPNTTGEPGTWSANGRFFAAPEINLDAESGHILAFLPINGIINDLSAADVGAGGLVEDTSPVYSPDGQWLAFARRFLDPDRWTPGRQLWVMDANGENARALTFDELYTHTSFAWSPDSEQIAFVRAHRTAPDSTPEIWLIHADGSAPLLLLLGGYNPQWIPNGGEE